MAEGAGGQAGHFPVSAGRGGEEGYQTIRGTAPESFEARPVGKEIAVGYHSPVPQRFSSGNFLHPLPVEEQ